MERNEQKTIIVTRKTVNDNGNVEGKEVKKEITSHKNEEGKTITKMRVTKKSFSEPREKVPANILQKAKEDGVVQKDNKGQWRIVAIKKGEYWNAVYKSKKKAQAALSAYHANK